MPVPLTKWTLGYNGQRKEAADWGMVGLKLNLISQGQDKLTMIADGFSLDVPDTFAYGGKIELRDPAGVRRFVGTVIDTPLTGDAKGESRSYVIAGPWWDLDNLVYQLRWKYYVLSNGVWTATDMYSPHLILGLDFFGLNLTSSQQAIDVVDYAISQGVSIQRGAGALQSILPDRATPPIRLFPPPDEVRDITCAEALKKMLRWHPNAVQWFDYTVDPPLLNIRLQQDLTSKSVYIPQALPHSKPVISTAVKVETFEARPRYDLQRTVVAINFISKGSVNGQSATRLVQDYYPVTATGRELGALSMSIDLQGTKSTSISQYVETIPRDFSLKSYWIDAIPTLSDPRVDAATINGPNELTRSGALNLPNEVLNGAVAEWMKTDAGFPAALEEDVIAAKFSFKVFFDKDDKPAGGEIEDVVSKLLTKRLKMTNLFTGTYTTLESFEAGDIVPIGLAQYLWTALSPLTYEGEITMVEEYCGRDVELGNVVNALNIKAEYATINALVQRVSMDIDNGRTRLTFGPPPHLSAGDIIDLLKVGRNRQRFTNRLSRSTGIVKDSTLALPKYTEATDTAAGKGAAQRLRVTGGANTSAATGAPYVQVDGVDGYIEIKDPKNPWAISMKLSDCVGAGVKRSLKIKETDVCELVGGIPTTRKALVLRSDSY